MDKEPITLNGLNKLKEELIYLKEKKRPEIVSAIAEARSHGDLKENAEYHAAKEEQGLNEKRIREIEGTIARAEIIDITKISSEEGFGISTSCISKFEISKLVFGISLTINCFIFIPIYSI